MYDIVRVRERPLRVLDSNLFKHFAQPTMCCNLWPNFLLMAQPDGSDYDDYGK